LILFFNDFFYNFFLRSKSLTFQKFARWFGSMHMFVMAALFVIGLVCNTSMIVVLCRRTMRSPVNTILVAMVCCDSVRLWEVFVECRGS
jgi:putative copper export protein